MWKMFLTMINARSLSIYLVVLSFFSLTFGQNAAPSSASGGGSSSSARFMPLASVKEGMRGTAKTVFRGTEPEEFNVEILGVLPGGVGPKQDLIIGRLSGGPADRTAVFAGMSGSPVYIDGKLVGAISYRKQNKQRAACAVIFGAFRIRDPAGTAKNRRKRTCSRNRPEFGNDGGRRAVVSADSDTGHFYRVGPAIS
jgi:hypothetical protein